MEQNRIEQNRIEQNRIEQNRIEQNRIENDGSQSTLVAHVDHKNNDSINQVMNEIEKLFEN